MQCLCGMDFLELKATLSDNLPSTGLITCCWELLQPGSNHVSYNPSLAQGHKTESTAGKPIKK